MRLKMSTNSAVIQLQQEALDDTCSVEKLVRLAYTIAMKLDMTEMIEWCNNELSGYQHNIPMYRLTQGDLIAQHSNGAKLPVSVAGNEKIKYYIAIHLMTLSISEIIQLNNSQEDYTFFSVDKNIEELILPQIYKEDRMRYPNLDLINNPLYDSLKPTYRLQRAIHKSQFGKILSEIRKYILDWAISLEKAGILGENLVFTKEEKIMSANVTYNIQNVGNMANHNQHSIIQQLSSSVQKGDFNSLESALKSHGISAEYIQELREILDNTQQPVNELPTEVDGWLGKIGRTVNDISIQTIAGLVTTFILG